MASPGKKAFLLRIDPALWTELERLAAQAHMSARNFARVYKDRTGCSPARALERFRIGAARRMLEQSGFAVTSLRLVRHSDWLRSSAKLSATLGRSNWRQHLLTNKRVAKFVTLLQFLRGQSDCMLATAEKPESIADRQLRPRPME